MLAIIIIIIAIIIVIYFICNTNTNKQLDQRFYDHKQIYPELDNIKPYENDILNEFNQLINSKEKWIDWTEKSLYSDKPNNDWKIMPIYVFGMWHKKNSKLMPQLTKFAKSLPNLKTVLLSKLGPKTSLKGHKGWKDLSNYILRCHYGLKVPESCFVYVKDDKEEIQYHKNKEWIVFDDSKTHSATNNSNEDRYVLIIDLIRPECVKTGKSNVEYSKELIDLVNEFKATSI